MASSVFSKTDLARLRDIGWSLWDPIGMMPEGLNWRDEAAGGFEDEYDRYLESATAQLRQGVSADDVAHYLAHVETEQMSLARRPDTLARARAVVQAILADERIRAAGDA